MWPVAIRTAHSDICGVVLVPLVAMVEGCNSLACYAMMMMVVVLSHHVFVRSNLIYFMVH